ncbi:hypothetical protein ACR9GP_22785 [Enterobacter ludwigii]
MTEVTFRVRIIQFTYTAQAVQQRSAFTTMFRADEQELLTTQTGHPQGIFSVVIFCFNPAIMCIVPPVPPTGSVHAQTFLQALSVTTDFHHLPQLAFQGFSNGFVFN